MMYVQKTVIAAALTIALAAPVFAGQDAPGNVRLPSALGGGPEVPVDATEREALKIIERWTRKRARPGQGTNGAVVFTYGERMPMVRCKVLRECMIELEPGEQVIGTPHVSDATRWIVSPMVSGTPDGKTVTSLIVKPKDSGLETDITIPTDRRVYNILVRSSTRHHMHRVQFAYPADMFRQWQDYAGMVKERQANEVAVLPNLTAEGLRFDYVVTGDQSWAPIRVFDDGRKTYFQIPGDAQVSPVLFIAEQGVRKILNYRQRRGYYIADRVLTDGDRWEMVYGEDNEPAIIERGEPEHRARKPRDTVVHGWGSNNR